MLKIEGNFVVDDETGEIITKDLSPKFLSYDYFDRWKEDGLRFIEPMSCKVLENIDTEDFKGKIAEQKFDGHRCLCYVTPKGNRMFSRRVSKKTGWYSENTDCMPHLRDFKVGNELFGTVLDGELLTPTGTSSSDIMSVTGALPETAIANQEADGCATLHAFDILYYKGVNVQNSPLWKRKLLLHKYLQEMNCPNIEEVPLYYSEDNEMIEKLKEAGIGCIKVASFKELRDSMWERGLEGLVVKTLTSKYEQKRSKEWLKVKEVNTYDVIITGYQEPTRLFTGKTDRETWEFWEYMDYDDAIAVTKPYYMGWVGAIECGLYKDGVVVKITEVKGITDADQVYIKAHREELIGTVIEVKAQGIIDKKTNSLRHPRFSKWRPDKSAEMCKWEEFE